MEKFKFKNPAVKSIAVSIIFGLINALNCWLFIIPNDYVSSGVEGISIMIQRVTRDNLKLNLSYIQLAINIPLCIFAFFRVSKTFAVNTAIYSLSYSVFYKVFETLGMEQFRYFAGNVDTIYPVAIAGIISGFAYGILFRDNSSSGGVDIISKYVNKKNPKFNFFYVTFTINAAIAILSYFVFAENVDGVLTYSYRPVCMCVLCDFISNFIGDKIIRGGEAAYKFFVVADNVRPIEKDIAENLVHTSTRFDCFGSYTNTGKQSLMCLVTKNEIVEFENILKRHPDCFAFVEPVNKVIGYFDK